MKTTFIYALIDPRNGQVRYIGKSNKPNARLSCHLSDKLHEAGNNHKVNWIKSLLKQNLKPELFILDEVLQSEWQFWEQYYISLFKSFGFALINITTGGDGGNGVTVNSTTKKKISEKTQLQWQNGRGWKKRSSGYKVKRDICMHCKKEFALNTLSQYHNENCKYNPNITQQQLDRRKHKKKSSRTIFPKHKPDRIYKKHKKHKPMPRGVCFCCGNEYANHILAQFHNDKCKLKKAA